MSSLMPEKFFSKVKHLKGMQDVLVNEMNYYEHVQKIIEEYAQDYGFHKIDTPILETSKLFERSTGKETDIVQKEMFSFFDKNHDKISLRPEGTPGVARAFIENGLYNLAQPLQLYYWGSMFRRENPQLGRRRQFTQAGFEIFSSVSSALDVQLIFLGFLIFEALNLKDISIQVNSIGCKECRGVYLGMLKEYYYGRKRGLCADCKKRANKNLFRILDCKEERCSALKKNAPRLIDVLCKACHRHFKLVLEYLDEVKIVYEINSCLVRGLDYYNRTVFEFVYKNSPELKNLSLGGGGRYDYLIESLGGKETPAVGMALGIERIILLLKTTKQNFKEEKGCDIFFIHLGELAKQKSLQIFEQLRKRKIKIKQALGKDSIKAQLKTANKMKAKFSIILGQKEAIDNTVLIREMESGIQEVVKLCNLEKEIIRRLKKLK